MDGLAGHDSAARSAAARVSAVARTTARRDDRAAPHQRHRLAGVSSERCDARAASSNSTSRIRCSACASAVSVSSFPRSTRCRCARSSKRPANCKEQGVDARPDVMIPGVGTKEEMQITREAAKARCGRRDRRARRRRSTYRIGTMIELPRACVVADELAAYAEFFSFGTNDLTQTTYGYSRDDAEASFIPVYLAEANPQGRSVSSARPARRRRADEAGGTARPRRAGGLKDRHLRRARRRAEQRRVLRSDWASTTFRARPTACPIARLAAAQSAIGTLT